MHVNVVEIFVISVILLIFSESKLLQVISKMPDIHKTSSLFYFI